MLTEDASGFEAAREAHARERLEELHALARTYRSWSVKELASALGRQPGRLVPESGMPKIDLVVGLAKALDWPVEAVVDHLMKPGASRRTAEQHEQAGFAELYNASLEHRARRDFSEAVRLAVRAGVAADTPTRQAAALYIESLAQEAMGSYVEAVRCLREALRIEGVGVDWRLLCDAQLANMTFMQGHGTHAIGMASSVLDYSAHYAESPTVLLARALAHWARGHALRSTVPLVQFDAWRPLALSARDDFRAASALAERLAECPSISPGRNLTFAACIEPAMLELDAVCEPACAPDAANRLIEAVRAGGDHAPSVGERKAWAAVALSCVARRHCEDEAQRRGMLEIASSALRAHAVATSNWYFAHLHLELDAERRKGLAANGYAVRALDAAEARLVAGVIGQVPIARARADEYLALYAAKNGGAA
ncbi:MAG: hypothetical protein ACKOYN_00155 [Planctomycetota bacterium]